MVLAANLSRKDLLFWVNLSHKVMLFWVNLSRNAKVLVIMGLSVVFHYGEPHNCECSFCFRFSVLSRFPD